MRVLMTADALGGVWTYALALAEGLRAYEVDVIVAVMGPRPTEAQRAEAVRCGVGELHESDFRLEWMTDPWEDLTAAGEWLLDLAHRSEADLVHLNGYAHVHLPWPAPVVVGAHSCVFSWWRAVHGCSAPPEWARYRHMMRGALDAADAVVSPTRALVSLMINEYGPIPGARVVHNGLAGEPLGSLMGEPLVLATGRFWDEGKNLAVLDNVAPMVSWQVCAAGDCGFDGVVRLPRHVTHLGRLERNELRAWQRRAAIAVHPARYEPFGFVPLEAARAGCALVLSDIPTLRELWDGAALFADPDDARGFAAAINSMIEDPAALISMAARATSRARSFTSDRMTGAYVRIYRELASGEKPTRRVACAS